MRGPLVRLGALLLLTMACGGRPIPEPEQIPVPPGVGAQATEIAILSALMNLPPPAIYDPRAPMPRETYEQMVWNYYLTSPGRGWVVESRDPGRVVAKIARAKYLLRIQVQYDQNRAAASILESSGLAQQDGRIHRKAVGWILKLEQRIRTELARFAGRARYESEKRSQ
jgi:hypothetical protein